MHESRARRWLVRLLCFGLCPILVLGVQSPGHAAVTYGPAASTVLVQNEGGIYPFNEMTCTVQAYWSGGDGAGYSVETNANCARDFDNRGTGLDLTFEGATGDGDVCEASVLLGSTSGDPIESGVLLSGAGPISAGAADVSGCHMVEMCYMLWQDRLGYPPNVSDEGCVPMDLGPMVADDDECAYLNVGAAPSMTTPPELRYGVYWRWWQKIDWDLTPTSEPDASQWIYYYIATPGSPEDSGYPAENFRSPQGWAGRGNLTVNSLVHPAGYGSNVRESRATLEASQDWTVSKNGYNRADDARVGYQIIGAGLFRRDNLAGNSADKDNWKRLPQDGVYLNPMLGVNDPGTCAFYWGAKIAETPDDRDEPRAALGAPPESPTGGTPDPPPAPTDPPETEGGCDGFSFTDPSSWAGAGICVLVKLVRTLINVLGEILGLIGGLVGAILDGLKALFIPDISSWPTTELVDQVGDAGPTAALGEVGSAISEGVGAYSSASDGCGVLGTAEGVPLSSCEAAGVLVPLRGVVAAGLVIMTGIGIMRMVAGVTER